MSKLNSKQAFTLVEALLVLFIMGFMLLVLTITPQQKMTNSINDRIFFDQLVSELNLGQTLAITHNQALRVNFSMTGQTVSFELIESNYPSTQLYLPSNWRLKRNFQFIYLANGRINRFDTVTFYHTQTSKTVSIVFQLGSGRFELRS